MLDEGAVLKGWRAQKAYRWLRRLLEGQQGEDWRRQLERVPEKVRGLGAMEGNVAHLIADRMKGRSWSPKGALHLAKVREAYHNGTLRQWCFREETGMEESSVAAQAARKRPLRKYPGDDGVWLQVQIPALKGPHPRHPALQRLKEKIYAHRLN